VPSNSSGGAPLDHHTDIYSLGATLYEMLALQPPFTGERRDQVSAQILHKEPQPPRRLNKRIPVDLETICLKALEKDPDRRYQTAGALAEDLRRFVNRFAIGARRAGPLQRLAKWARRHPALAAVSTVAVVALALAGGFADQARRAEQRVRREQLHHFQSTVDARVFVSMDDELSRALLARMDRDPGWPPWVK